MVCTSPTQCSRFGSIGSIAYDASLRQGVCLTISVTKSDQIWCIKDNRLCKMLYNQQFTKSFSAPDGSTFICSLSIYYKFSKLKRKLKKSVSRPVVSAFLDGNIFLICRARCIREGHRQKSSFG